MSLAAPPILYHQRDFAFFTSGRFLSTVAMQMQSVAIGWQIYSITNSAFALGLVGLCQFAPMFLLTLPAGDTVPAAPNGGSSARSESLIKLALPRH
jgi:hypothetical protein